MGIEQWKECGSDGARSEASLSEIGVERPASAHHFLWQGTLSCARAPFRRLPNMCMGVASEGAKNGIEKKTAKIALTNSLSRPYSSPMSRHALAVLPLLWWSSVAFAAAVPESTSDIEHSCGEMRDSSEFFDATKRAEEAFAGLDEDGLQSAYVDSRDVLQCLQGEIQGMMAAAFHRTTAMVAFVGGDRERVLQEFNRARLLHLGYEIPGRVAPEGHPLWQLYAESKTMGEGVLQRGIPRHHQERTAPQAD